MKAEFKKWWTAEGKELFSLLVNDVSYSDAYLVWKAAVLAAQKDLEPWLRHHTSCQKRLRDEVTQHNLHYTTKLPLPEDICSCGLDEKRKEMGG